MLAKIDAWLRLAAVRIHDEAPALTALDQSIGDGDHGISMDRGFEAVIATLDAGEPDGDGAEARAGARLRSVGRTLIATVGGASGPLYGTAFMRAGGALVASGTTAGARALVDALDAGIGGIVALGKAQAGEKTMLDALFPALEAGRRAADAGATVAMVAKAMADAAEAGAIATVPMQATKGRASYLGERSIGYQDPGATSSALLLRALADVTSDT